MKHLVVGGGIIGLSVAWALVRRGEEVTLLEQGPWPNPLASSIDDHRLIRYPYGSARGYCRLVHDAYAAWDTLWHDLGQSYYVETGTLVLGRAQDDWPRQSMALLAEEKITFESLTPDTAARRFPHLNLEDCGHTHWLPTGGILMARHIAEALGIWLRKQGMPIIDNARVATIDSEQTRLRLADGREMTADRIVIAAGPWTADLLPQLASRVVPSRQVIIYAEAPKALVSHWQSGPMVLEIGNGAGFYAVPPRLAPDGTQLGLKMGDHSFSMSGHPNHAREPSPEEGQAMLALCAPRLARASEYRVDTIKTCFYDVAEDERFIIERLSGSTIAMAGFSGHGFKFAPWLGLGLAAVLAGSDFSAFSRKAAGHGA